MPNPDNVDFLAPLAGHAPCGADLEYEPVFQAMQAASQVRPETQYGATITPAQPPDWALVRQHALTLATRTRDLRVAVALIRSGARVEGFRSAVDGLRLLLGMIESLWDGVHPALDAGDGDDATARISALAALVHDTGLADWRAARLGVSRGSVRVRELELAQGHAEPLPGESVPTREGVRPAVTAALTEATGLAAAMAEGVTIARAIARVLDARLGGGVAPDLTPLVRLLQAVADVGEAATSGAPGAPEVAALASIVPVARTVGEIESRADAVRTLQRVAAWIERNEPSNPAPLLIARAERLMAKSFLEIIEDLLPDGVSQVQKLAGPGRP